MTLPAGTNLDLSPYCDKILGFFYFKKSNGFIDTDLVDQELSIPYEHCEIAIKKLETDGFLKISETSVSKFAKITPSGEVYYRTSSYQNEASNSSKKRKIESIRILKDIVELIVFLFTLALGIYTFSLNKDIEDLRKEIRTLKASKVDIEKLKKEIVKIKVEIEKSKKLKTNTPAIVGIPKATPHQK